MLSLKRLILVPLFIAIQVVLYVLIIGPFSINKVEHVCYLSIIISFIFGLLFFNIKKSLLTLSLFFVLLADFFLVPHFRFGEQVIFNQVWGMIFFNIAQFVIAIYLFFNSSIRQHLMQIIVRSIVIILSIGLPFLILKEKNDFLSAISVIYFGTFICNLLFTFFNFRKNKILSIGLLLFFLCDIVTGLSSAASAGYLPIDPSSWFYQNILFGNINFVWLFYLPGISLICLSIPNYKRLI